MCGIAGTAGTFDQAEGEALLKDMLKVIEHRGPDSNGIWSTQNFAFGMQRLSIIDLAGGDQPIWSEQGVGIVFNGEIYNFKHLKTELEQQGIKFKTNCDTEVILQLYIQKGLEFVHSLEGMFAICLYDPHLKKVYLIRDRLGVKPLYYFHSLEQFIFGSEIKSILPILRQKQSISHQGVWDYLTLRYVPSPETIWQGIYKLEPGHYLEYDLEFKQLNITKYWSVDFHSERNQSKNYAQEFEQLFLQAVEKRLLAADVPVGILLSGGLDSSCVAAAALELGHKNFHTFSIGFADGGNFSELGYAQQVADYIGSQHHEVTINKTQFIDFIDDFVYFSDEPLADLASIPLYYVSKLARQHVKVVLSGEGSDEILAGYNLDNMARTLLQLKKLSWLPNFLLRLLPYQSTKILSKYGYSNFLKIQASHMTNIFSQEEKYKLCKFSPQLATTDKIKAWYDLSSSKEPIDQLQQVYCHSWLVEDLLMKADKMSMATSLELRVPFLDHKLVEWAAKLPLDWKVGNDKLGFTTKKILRNFAAARLPKEIIDRPKQGFPVPAYYWLQDADSTWFTQRLYSPTFEKYFKKEEVEKIFDLAQKGSVPDQHKIWNLMIFSAWLNRWSN